MLTDASYPELPEWLHGLYPFRTRMLDIEGCRMSLVDEGAPEAAPVLLLHGSPTWSFLYRHIIHRLRERFRVIAPDHVGFGLSDKPAARSYHTLERHVSNFTQMVEALRLRNITLGMNGWGGPIGLGYAIAHPDNIARLVLANAWGTNLPHVKRVKQPLGVRIAAKGWLGRWLDSLLNLSLHSAFPARTHQAMGDLAFEAYKYPFPDAKARAAVAAFTCMLFEPDRATIDKLDEIQGSLKNIAAPAKILWGARDELLGKLPAYILRDELKHAAEPVFLPECSHYVPEEAPDMLADTLLAQPKPAASAQPDSVFKIIG